MIYVVVEMGGLLDMRREICEALAAGDWYTSSIASLAEMDQYNYHALGMITDEQYFSGDFTLMGVVKLGDEGLVTSYSN